MMNEEQVHLDEKDLNITIDDNNHHSSAPSYTSPRHVGAAGVSKYLKPSDLMQHTVYEFAIIANRSIKVDGFTRRCSFSPCCTTNPNHSSYSRLCRVNSPLLKDGEDEHLRIVEKLTSEGLKVDIIDGGHSEGEMTSDYFILLVSVSDDVIRAYTRKFRHKLWFDNGSIRDFKIDFGEGKITPAEKVEIVAYIIKKRANITTEDPWIHDIFPLHNENVSQSISKYISSFGTIEYEDTKFLSSIRENFGEKVAYYFAFINFYNRSLIPIASVGFLYFVSQTFIPTTVYMRLLPFWGILVSVIWSFSFLKLWDRKNAEMQHDWNQRVKVKLIEYPNKKFYGERRIDPITGEVEIYYAAWKRYPKYFCVFIFMVFQTLLMLMLVALWVSVYELLKVKYPDGRIFSTQWFLILLEGIVFGLFVDVIQWNIVVTKFGKLFTHWENHRTEEAFERALIRKLFIMDFLNYYTWFFSLAFVYVIPGFGDFLTNCFNSLFFGDDTNCCFGSYVDNRGTCISCPTGLSSTCIRCVGWFTFDRHHVNLSAMFVTPILVTQSLNMLVAFIMPILAKHRSEKAFAAADAQAQARVREAGSMKILASLNYQHGKGDHLQNKSHIRYLEYSAEEIEKLNKKAREILFQSQQGHYDPYNDFHVLTVQFGFTVMFSVLWPLMPLACMLINSIKLRVDGYRLTKTLQRPFPKKANGIGGWKGVFTMFAYIAILVNIALICISTGSIEFYSDQCIRDIQHRLQDKGKTMNDFVLGPNFGCLHFTWRLLIIIIAEHIFLGAALYIVFKFPGVPEAVSKAMASREKRFKTMLQENATKLPFDRSCPHENNFEDTFIEEKHTLEEDSKLLSKVDQDRNISLKEIEMSNHKESKATISSKFEYSDDEEN